MQNILRVLWRDFIRLLKAPAALVVVGALLILPSAYTWYNVVAFWNPYDNTGSMRVAVVNLDAGAQNEITGTVNVGEAIVDSLKENKQLKWVFDDYDHAMADLEAGENYAVFVLPEDFSENMISMVTGEIKTPSLHYYVNEKAGPVSPKVTDTGATTLEQTINSTFVTTVTEAVAESVAKAFAESDGTLADARSQAERKIDQAMDAVQKAQSSLGDIESAAVAGQQRVEEGKAALARSRQSVAEASKALSNVSDLSDELSESLSGDVMDAVKSLDDALSELESMEELLSSLGLAEEYQKALALIIAARSHFSVAALDETIAALKDLSNTSADLSVTVSQQQMVIDQLDAAMTQLGATLGTLETAVGQTNDLLSGLSSDLSSIRTDVVALAQSSALSSYIEKYGLSTSDVADFMGSPTSLKTEHLYQLNAYGSAMAPLFMNLTFWIGAFCLLIIMKQEVDDQGIPSLSFTQRYLARFILFAVLCVLQACICVAGVLFIGVEVASAPALFVASIAASLAFLSIIYNLSVVFQHIGKGICIVLVFLQIPAATGLYPIEMTSAFYQAISPIFPFTYGIAAIRECICGFYGSAYVEALLSLAVFFLLFLILGIALRPLMSSVNLMVSDQVRESGMFNGEDVEVPPHNFKGSEILDVLRDREGYQEKAREGYRKFLRRYPLFIRGSVVLGVTVPVLLLLLHSFSVLGKVNLLTIWLVWLVAWFVFLVVVENFRYRFEERLGAEFLKGGDTHA